MENSKPFSKNNTAMPMGKYRKIIITIEIVVHVCDYQNKIGSINELCGKSRSIQIYYGENEKISVLLLFGSIRLTHLKHLRVCAYV